VDLGRVEQHRQADCSRPEDGGISAGSVSQQDADHLGGDGVQPRHSRHRLHVVSAFDLFQVGFSNLRHLKISFLVSGVKQTALLLE